MRRQSGMRSADDDVEVVELMEGATSENGDKESKDEASTKNQKRREREEGEESGADDSEQVLSGDVHLLTPPTKKRRKLSQTIAALETLIEVVADDEEVLSTRLEYCSNVWRLVREMPAHDVVEFVRQRGSSVIQIIEALLHTGYFPLQQLCFMAVAAILHQLHKHDTDVLAAFVMACNQSLSHADIDLLQLLPLHEPISWHDPRIARNRIVQINRRTGQCHSFRVARCWVSPKGKQDLTHIRVNKWIDVGSTTTTFYWRDQSDIVVVNVPHSCVEDVEIERDNSIIYVWTKHLDRLKGVRLLAFATNEEDFPGLVKALVGVEIEGYVGSPGPIPDSDFGSPVQTLKTTASLVLAPQSPTHSVAETDDLNAFEPEYNDSSSETADPVDPIERFESELDAQLEEAGRKVSVSLDSLHQRLDIGRESITDTFARVSSSVISGSQDLQEKEYEVTAAADKLQQKRLLDLMDAKALADSQVATAVAQAERHGEDAVNYAAENLMQTEPDFAFTSASIALLLVVVIPWVLFAVQHSGSDIDSVRQLAQDALMFLVGALRRLSR